MLVPASLCILGCWKREIPPPEPVPGIAAREVWIRHAREVLLGAIARDIMPHASALAEARSAYVAAGPETGASAWGVALVAGFERLAAGDAAAARAAFASVVGEDEELLASHGLGLLALAEGASLEAWGEFDQLTRLRPEWTWARVLRTAADAGLGASDGIAVLTDAVTRWPKSAELATALGRALESVGSDPEAGSEWYARAVALGARDRFVIERFATFSLEHGEAAHVRAILTPLVAAHPEWAFLHLHLGRAQASLGESGLAAGSFGAALRLEPGDHELRVQLATHLANLGDLMAALAVLREGLDASPREPMLTGYLGHVELALGRADPARELLSASCRGGFDPSCIEACHLGDERSCGDRVFVAESLVLRPHEGPDRVRRRPTFKGGAVTVAEHSLGP